MNAPLGGRYKNIVPMSRTRVVLPMLGPGDLESTYVNASFVCGPDGDEKRYIAAMVGCRR